MIVEVSLAAGVIALSAAIWMKIEAFGYRVRNEVIETQDIPDAFHLYKILFITDIHRRKLSERKILSLNLQPDCIMLGGDITEKGVPWERVGANLEILRKIAPVYAVLGNHDLKAGSGKLETLFEEPGLLLLKDDTVMLNKNGDSIALSGIMQPVSRNDPYSSFLGNAHKGQYHIVLVHDPIWIKDRRSISANLILAGHTHGGQIVLPFLGAARLEGFYKKYNAGWYHLGHKAKKAVRMLISRGFGTSHIPLRFRSPSEIHLITLIKKP
ncbi:metallophosphoesterase [Paenibacillus dakarensis]|uniref:metallophosphoesterase n=1 Tax=Paenibacillus dakarensis TaxID=1527293 RepID=UPI000ACCA7DA|nr:metallophosphoesterase [Paenibacillus dakarensis]